MKLPAFLLMTGCLCASACNSRGASPHDATETAPSISPTAETAPMPSASAPADISRNTLTQHNDAQRTGVMLNETVLNTNNVNSTSFGLLRTLAVQGWVYAQPLYVENLTIAGSTRNVVFIATAHNSVYAFDADNANSTAPLWEVNLGPSFPMSDFPGLTNLGPEEGIIATPVIDLASQSMWLTAALKEPATQSAAAVYKHQLFRLNILTGKIMSPGPVTLTAQAPGTGFESKNGMVGFSEPTMLQRSSLLLANGQIYLGFAGAGVTAAYHGWLLSYDANSLAQTGAFTTSPNSSSSGIWQGGQGPAVDSAGYVYACSADGNNSDATQERIESLMKFKHSAAGMQLVDYFTPAQWKQFDINDLDFGSTGVVLVPNQNMTVSGDKSGNLYFANTQHLGGLTATDASLYQKVSMGNGTGFFGSPVYYDGPKGPRVYAWAHNDVLKAWDVSSTNVPETPIDQSAPSSVTYLPGAMLSVSAHGNTPGTGIVWATTSLNGPAGGTQQQGALLAYDASDLGKQLYSSQTNSKQDSPGLFGKFNPPTIAAGKVFVGTFSNVVAVYGLK